MIAFVLVVWMSLSFLLGGALVAGSWLRARRRRSYTTGRQP